MRPTKSLGDASRPPDSDPGASLVLIAVILASIVAIAHPLATAGLAAVVATGWVLKRTVRISENGYVCVPRFDRCFRILPA